MFAFISRTVRLASILVVVGVVTALSATAPAHAAPSMSALEKACDASSKCNLVVDCTGNQPNCVANGCINGNTGCFSCNTDTKKCAVINARSRAGRNAPGKVTVGSTTSTSGTTPSKNKTPVGGQAGSATDAGGNHPIESHGGGGHRH